MIEAIRDIDETAADVTDRARDVTDASFEADVLASPVPVLVDFWAEWCAPCRMIAPLVADLAAAYSGRLSVARIDIEENPAAVRRYQVRSIPTLMLFREGRPVATQAGTLNRAQLVDFVEKHLE